MAEHITDKRKKNFINQFQKFTDAFDDADEMVSIVFVEGKVSYDISSMYERYLGRYLNETVDGKPTQTASWCRSLRYELQKHDKKYSPKYLKLKEKIRVFRKNINLRGNTKFRIGREIKNIFKSRKKELETLRTSARMLFEDASKDLKNIFDLYSDKEKLDKFDNDTLISACKSNIKNVLNIIALNSDPLVDDQRLYDQLKLPKDKEIDNMEKSLIKRISSGDNKKSNSSSEKELMKFQLAVRSFFDSFSDSGRYKTSLTPIIFKPKKEAEKYKSIAAVFKEYFGSFFYKHRILSPTSDWCQCLYEELRAHGMKYECKYREIRKKIKANEARVNKRGNDILETSGAVSTFTEARGNLIKIFYNSLFRLKDFVSFKTDNISKLLNNLENIDRDQLFKELKKDS